MRHYLLCKKHDFQTEDIRIITICCPPGLSKSFVAKPFQIRDYPHCDAIFSLKFTCATALLYKDVRQEHFTEAAIRSPKIINLINKIEIQPLEKPKTGIAVVVNLADGRTFNELVTTATGDPINKALTKKEIIEKYFQQVEFSQTIKKDQASSILDMIENIDEADDLSGIIGLLVG